MTDTPIRVAIYGGAKNPVPLAADDFATWDEWADELALMCELTAADKTTLLAFAPHRLRAPYRKAENVEAVTLLVIDVDRCDLVALLGRVDASGWACLVYESPSSTPDVPRVRVVAPITRELTPAECRHTRLAFAEALGLGPGSGVEGATDASKLFFVGALDDTTPRETWRADGAPVDVDALLDTAVSPAWRGSGAMLGASSAQVPAAPADASAIVAVLGDAHAHQGHRWHLCGAIGGIMRRMGFSAAACEGVIRAWLPEGDPSINVAAGVKQALGAWSKPAAEVSGNEALAAVVGDALASRILEACAAERRPTPEFAPPADAPPPETPLLVRSHRGDAVWIWSGDELGHLLIGERVLPARVRELGLESLIPLRDAAGRRRPPSVILDDQAATVYSVCQTFAATRAVYDPKGTGTMTSGFQIPPLEAAEDRDVAAWLEALGGEEAHGKLLDWLASCAQRYIDRLAACLVILGPADIGKSALGVAVARTWGATPPNMGLLVERFNGDMLRCPLLVDEEGQLFGSRSLSTKRFRDVVQETERPVELKGRERIQLIGAQRYLVPCNSLSDIRFRDVGGSEVVQALQDRMLVIDAKPRAAACKAALARLRLPGSYLIDMARVAAHVAWLGATREIAPERFIGAGGMTRDAVLSGHATAHREIYEALSVWLESTDNGRGPWYARDGGLYVDDAALARTLAMGARAYDLGRTVEALEPFTVRRTRITVGDGRSRERVRLRVVELDAESLASVALDEIEAEELLERLGG